MTWVDRLESTIKMTSPDGNVFNPKWRGNSRRKEKKLGIFSYPKVKKNTIQDLEVNSTTYPLTVYFDGEDNDLDADSFFSSCDETGLWIVIHPVIGSIFLQLVSVEDQIEPIESGNIRVFQMEFIEPSDEQVIASQTELSSSTQDSINKSNTSGAEGFKNKVKAKSAAARTAISNTTGKITTAVNNALSPLFTLTTESLSIVNSIQRGIQDTLDATILKPLSLAAQIQQLIQTPSLVATDIKARFNAYKKLSETIFSIEPENDSEVGLATASIKELASVSIFCAIGNIATTNNFNSREEAIESIDFISSLFSDITDNLDIDQDKFINSDIDFQYFSQSDSFNDNTLLTAKSIKYIYDQIISLRIAKFFTIDKPRSPIEITITEYGDLGENDLNLDFFIETNKLKSNDIRLLAAGTRVLVYV